MQTESLGAASVSVVIPAYNAASYLAAALDSVYGQTVRPAEVIVVDDGSADATPEIARSFGARVISLANKGPSAARNAGVQEASGDFVAYLDADDIWFPEKLSTQLAALAAHGAPAFSFTDFRAFDGAGVHRPKSELRRRAAFRRSAGRTKGRASIVFAAKGDRPVLYGSYIMPSSLLVRRADALAVGGFDESLRVTEDYEFCLRLFTIVPAIVILQPLLLYRQHAAQATSNGTLMKAGFFEVAKRVASSPERYPPADARYIGQTEYLRYFSLGMQQARLGFFDDAEQSLRKSLAARPTRWARVALLGTQACRSGPGRRSFDLVRTLWKRRPGKR
jgi:glycosyltransferase involved in cell wall biosynthesis